ncbi:UNVERIFIED_CONTAM: hypothetical protein Scaly_2054000 [Sesamum calycinum]|uniref:Retrotransposon gag domain-containing protein n=1 Tax=Sesamum calycinum TaxID=2727403 RepID=A0AAW2N273_9LAMI
MLDCKIFRTTLSGKVMAWFNQLLTHTIENFEQLSQYFLHHFSINKRYPKKASFLFTIVQQEQESLRDYVQRFSEAVLEVPHLNHKLLASILQQSLRRGRFRESIASKAPATLDELLKRAAKYIRIEEALKPKTDTNNKRKVREWEKRDPRREGLAEGQMHMPLNNFTRQSEELKGVESSKRREKGKENLTTAGVIGVVVVWACGKRFSPSTKDIAFSRMGIGMEMLTRVNTPLVGLNGSVVKPMGDDIYITHEVEVPYLQKNRRGKRGPSPGKRMSCQYSQKEDQPRYRKESSSTKQREEKCGNNPRPCLTKKSRIEEEKLAAAEELKTYKWLKVNQRKPPRSEQ